MLHEAFLIFWGFAVMRSFGGLVPPTDELDKLRDSLVNCILSISDRNFQHVDNVAFIVPSVSLTNSNVTMLIEGELLKVLFESKSWSVFTRNSSKPSQFFDIIAATNNYIIHIRKPIDILEILRFLKLSSWNPHAKFVIFTTTLFDEPADIASDIITALWSFHILNAIILIPRIDDTTVSDIFTWYPYALGNCGDNFKKTEIMNNCQRGLFNSTSELFPDKIPSDLNGCPVVTRTLIWPPYIIQPLDFHPNETTHNIKFTDGMEIKLVNTIAQAANFTPVYKISGTKQDWGEILLNGSASEGLFRELLDEEADIAVAALAATLPRYMHLDYTTTYTKEAITWCVPAAAEESKWLSLKRILQNSTWLATILSLCFVILLVWRSSLITPKESKIFKRLGSCAIYIFCTSLSIPLRNCPRQPCVRAIFIMWTIFSFLLCVAFQTLLMTKLTHPDFEPQLSDIEEIFNRKIPFGYIPGIRIYFQNSTDWVSEKLLEQGQDCDDAETCLKRVAINRDFAMALPRQYLQFVSRGFVSSSGESLIYWFTVNTVSYPVQIYAYKGYPLTPRLNDLVVRVVSGGFMHKWESDVMMSYSTSSYQEEIDEGSKKRQVLTFEHLKSAFAILSFGCILATIMFISELSIFSYKQKKIKSNKNC